MYTIKTNIYDTVRDGFAWNDIELTIQPHFIRSYKQNN